MFAGGRVFHVRSEEVCAWQAVVRMVAQAMIPKPHPAFSGAVQLELKFCMKTKSSKCLQKQTWHTCRPDVDNLAKPVEDALTGIAYRDDSQIARLCVSKVYKEPEGVEIVIYAAD